MGLKADPVKANSRDGGMVYLQDRHDYLDKE